MDEQNNEPLPYQEKFNAQPQQKREYSVNHSMISSTYSYRNTYEQLLHYFKDYQTDKIDINTLHCSKNLRLKKYKQAVYYGDQLNGKREGIGIMIYNSGQTYEGSWQCDNRHGKGHQKFANGCIYQGDYENNKMHGAGKYKWTNEQFYEGQWRDNMKNGTGMWKSQKDDIYVGEWKDGQAQGFGVFTQTNGNRYEGEFHHFIKNGQGTQKFSSGDIYKGQYIDGKFDGFGEYYWKDGSYYKGHFKKGVRCGHGLWKKSNQHSDKYQGQFLNNRKEGYGIYTWNSGHIYKGGYKNNLRHGYGEMYWSNGSFYKGNWQLDRQNGQGELFNGQNLSKGFFKDGYLVTDQQQEDQQTTLPNFKQNRESYKNNDRNRIDIRDYHHQKTPISLQMSKLQAHQITNFKAMDEARPVKVNQIKPINPLVLDAFLKKQQLKTIHLKQNIRSTSYSNNTNSNNKATVRTTTRSKTPHSSFQIHRLHRYKLDNTESPYDPTERTSDISAKFAFKSIESTNRPRFYSRMS